MTIVLCIVFAAVIIITASGQEKLGSHFELVKKAGAEENIGKENLEDKMGENGGWRMDQEKGAGEGVEQLEKFE